jgi:hypothetical protein
VKTVLENRETKCFFAKENIWVEDIEKAMCFNNSIEAEEVCKKEKLSKINILVTAPSGNSLRFRCC